MYGLRQSNRGWFAHLCQTLLSIGYKPVPSDKCLFVLVEKGKLVSMAFSYVDDGAIAGPPRVRRRVFAALRSTYPLKELGRPSWLLGMSIGYDLKTGTVSISQQQYIEQVLAR